MRVALAILLSAAAYAATITVCASGCDTASVQTAFNNAAGGDVVEIRAGETFEGAFTLPFKTTGGVITVRSSAWASLPPAGTRITAADAANMPKLMATNTTDAVLSAGYDERYVSSVNLGTDTLTFSSAHLIPDNSPFVCRVLGGTAPLTAYTIYYAKNVSGATMQVSATPGGATLDLTTPITATTFRCVRNDQIRGWTFHGIEFSGKVGSPSQFNLVSISSTALNRAGIIQDVNFQQVYIHGIQAENGAKNCLVMNTGASSIVDSRIEFCQREVEESHAIQTYLTPGPLLVRNNYIAGASINWLVGGNYVYVPDLVNGDGGGIQIIGNQFIKPPYLKYLAGTGGSGAPVGACTNDTYYLNTTTGALSKCASSTWGAAPTCANDEYYRRTDVTQNCASGACWKCASGSYTSDTVYRGGSYFVKNLFEIKSAINTEIIGNVFENNWGGNGDQNGTAVWITSLVSQSNADGWVRGQNIRFDRNIIRRSSKGFRIATEGGTVFGFKNNRISVSDVLMYEVGTNTTYPSFSDNNGDAMSFAGPCDYCSVDHVTASNVATGGKSVGFDTAAFFQPRLANSITYRNQYGWFGDLGLPVSDYFGTGNIINTVSPDNLSEGTGSFGAWATNGKYISNATTLFVGGGDYRLQATSPYSASCSSGCDFTSTDGKDLGADIDLVEMATGGAVSGAPWMGGSIRVSVGSTRAVATYTAPNGSACDVKLYTNFARTTLATDTDAAPEQLDSRAGSITAGTSRQFVMGTAAALTASTQYYLRVACGAQVAVVPFATRAAGADTVVTVRYGSATTGEYSANADMSSPTAIASSATHTVTLPTGTVRYYRQTGGLIQVFVAP